jgi:RimJ/RimL family protein N-acetyltransferase
MSVPGRCRVSCGGPRKEDSVDRWDVTIDIGEGMRLRPWRVDDLDVLVRHANDEQVSRGLSARFPFPYTREDGEAFLAGRVIDFGDPVFAIEIDGEAGGGIGVRRGQGERGHGAELGYWLGRAFWGQGRMTRAVAAFVPWVMGELRLYRLQAQVLDFNIGSARVLSKNGFVEEGLLRTAIFKCGRLHDLRLFARVRNVLDHA